jgi:topoisomerase-4 subunit A
MSKTRKPSNTAVAAAPVADVSFHDALGERYLAYAMSTITARSLPDVRDGLKPVHRRLLYAMLQLRLDPSSGYKKCARVVGDVIGKYHPHGDTAVYETMVRLAQSFAVRYPLVDGQGNFGSVDGDNAAAMRYTEARLTDVAMALLADIDSDTVDFRATYDGEDKEPLVLPAAFPNLLANGSEGIAVGMATSIPPHNVGEICEALLYLIKSPNCDNETLLRRMPGPDFPTGGVIVESQASIQRAYETGRGSIRIRAKWEVEQLERGNYQIVVTEIPYQVPKGRLMERVAELFRNKKLPLLGDLRDESAETIRVVFEPKNKQIPAEVLMESLFKVSDLETRFPVNLNMLTAEGLPKVHSLKEVLQAFLSHRREVLLRRSRHRIGQIAHRMEVLGGLLAAYLNLDEVIAIIRNEDEPKQVLMKRFELSDVQAEAILNMRLRSLRKLEEMQIRGEHKELAAERKALETLVKSEELQWEHLGEEIKETKAKFGNKHEVGKRRSEFAEAPQDVNISIEAFIEKEPITVLCSREGWVRAIKGHDDSIFEDAKYKEGDEQRFAIRLNTTDKLLVFASDGRFFTIGADKIPKVQAKKGGFGEPLRLMIDLGATDEVVEVLPYEPESRLLVASSAGKGFVVTQSEVLAQTKSGKQVLMLPDGAKAVACQRLDGADSVAIIGSNRRFLVFPLEQIPPMRKGQGVTLQKYHGAELSDMKVFALADGLQWQLGGGRIRHEVDVKPWLGNRAAQGKLPPVGFPRSNKFE